MWHIAFNDRLLHTGILKAELFRCITILPLLTFNLNWRRFVDMIVTTYIHGLIQVNLAYSAFHRTVKRSSLMNREWQFISEDIWPRSRYGWFVQRSTVVLNLFCRDPTSCPLELWLSNSVMSEWRTNSEASIVNIYPRAWLTMQNSIDIGATTIQELSPILSPL